MRVPSFLLFLLLSTVVVAQSDDGSSAETMICNHLFGEYQSEEPKKVRAALKSDGSTLSKLNPLRYAATGLMFIYQNVFSEQISSSCTYQISCSEMTKKSIESVGLIKGSFIGLHQLTNCSHAVILDHESFEISHDHKIINHIPHDD